MSQDTKRQSPFVRIGGSRRLLISLSALTMFVCVLSLLQPARIRLDDSDVRAGQQTHPSAAGTPHVLTAPDAVVVRSETAAAESDGEGPLLDNGWARELSDLKSLALQDPNAALDRIRELSVAEEQQAALREVCLVIATNDPALALHAAWSLQLGQLGGHAETTALEELARRWAASDLEAALTWTRQQPLDEEGRLDRVIKGIASVWSQRAPADAACLIAGSMSPNHAQFEATMNLVSQWATTDFPAASAWVDLFPSPLQENGRDELAKALARNPVSPESP